MLTGEEEEVVEDSRLVVSGILGDSEEDMTLSAPFFRSSGKESSGRGLKNKPPGLMVRTVEGSQVK